MERRFSFMAQAVVGVYAVDVFRGSGRTSLSSCTAGVAGVAAESGIEEGCSSVGCGETDQ